MNLGQGHVGRVSDVLGAHGGAQPPGEDVARVIIEHGQELDPAPPDDLEVGEVGLPHLVGPHGLVWKVSTALITV